MASLIRLNYNTGMPPLSNVDGITDTLDPEGELFGIPRLGDLAFSAGAASARELCDAIFDHLEQYQAGTTQSDDMTVMVVSLEGRREDP